MIFHLAVFFWAVVFYGALQLIASVDTEVTADWYIYSILLLMAVVFIANRRLTLQLKDVSLPLLLAVTTPTLLSFIDSSVEQQIFLLIATAMLYTALIGLYRLKFAPKDQTAVAFIHTAGMAALFLFYASIYGFYLNFTFPLWGLMVVFFIGTALTSLVTLGCNRENENKHRIKLYSVLLGLTMSELAWIISFWPFGYLTTASITLVFYFIAWEIAWASLEGVLTLKKTLIRMIFFFSLVILLLISTPWNIIV